MSKVYFCGKCGTKFISKEFDNLYQRFPILKKILDKRHYCPKCMGEVYGKV